MTRSASQWYVTVLTALLSFCSLIVVLFSLPVKTLQKLAVPVTLIIEVTFYGSSIWRVRKMLLLESDLLEFAKWDYLGPVSFFFLGPCGEKLLLQWIIALIMCLKSDFGNIQIPNACGVCYSYKYENNQLCGANQKHLRSFSWKSSSSRAEQGKLWGTSSGECRRAWWEEQREKQRLF